MASRLDMYKARLADAVWDPRAVTPILQRAAVDSALSLQEFLELYRIANDMLDMLRPAGGDNRDG